MLPAGTYYFCAIASNAAGTSFGEVVTFEVGEPPLGKKGGCDCQTGGDGIGWAAWLLVLTVLVVLRRRRRARPSGRPAR